MFKKKSAPSRAALRQRTSPVDTDTGALVSGSGSGLRRQREQDDDDNGHVEGNDDDDDTAEIDRGSAAAASRKRPRIGAPADTESLAALTRLVSTTSNSSQNKKEALKVRYQSTGAARSMPGDMGATRVIDIDAPEAIPTSTPQAATQAQSVPKHSRIGPQKSTQHIRITNRFDYQPDICKDYAQTGFCGYGDSCKFLHDRGDYKAGWQIDNEWNANQKARREAERLAMIEAERDAAAEYLIDEYDDKVPNAAANGSTNADEEEEDELPFACFICRNGFTNPVVSKCGHYFCEQCALDRYRQGKPKCAACGESTAGVFKPAKDLLAKIKVRADRLAAREREARLLNEGDEVDDDE